MKKQTRMKKGITLIEIILAIVLVALILGITIPKLMANSARAEIKAVISSDVKSIVEAAVLWRKSNKAAKGSFSTLDSTKIESRLPNTMGVDNNTSGTGAIESSGLRTGQGSGLSSGAIYYVTWRFSALTNAAVGTPGTPTSAFSIAMDTRPGIDALNWDSKLQSYANEVFQNTVAELTVESSDGDADYNYETISEAFGTGVDGDTTTLDCNTKQIQCSNLVFINR